MCTWNAKSSLSTWKDALAIECLLRFVQLEKKQVGSEHHCREGYHKPPRESVGVDPGDLR